MQHEEHTLTISEPSNIKCRVLFVASIMFGGLALCVMMQGTPDNHINVFALQRRGEAPGSILAAKVTYKYEMACHCTSFQPD